MSRNWLVLFANSQDLGFLVRVRSEDVGDEDVSEDQDSEEVEKYEIDDDRIISWAGSVAGGGGGLAQRATGCVGPARNGATVAGFGAVVTTPRVCSSDIAIHNDKPVVDYQHVEQDIHARSEIVEVHTPVVGLRKSRVRHKRVVFEHQPSEQEPADVGVECHKGGQGSAQFPEVGQHRHSGLDNQAEAFELGQHSAQQYHTAQLNTG
mmetsp:Transcript_12179/g.23288  ORF Transcript_12179/g.23288 Transcript_12179/m.23288 type:complete len:207 (-) Transcript_12179:1807-2427(-)